jgi:hypothetical protein
MSVEGRTDESQERQVGHDAFARRDPAGAEQELRRWGEAQEGADIGQPMASGSGDLEGQPGNR